MRHVEIKNFWDSTIPKLEFQNLLSNEPKIKIKIESSRGAAKLHPGLE